ncbi:MAG: hypothetical protein V3T86_01420 [Planctomycetota bacterium]
MTARSLVIALCCLTSASRAQDPDAVAWNQDPDVRAASEWLLFSDDERIGAYFAEHADAGRGMVKAFMQKNAVAFQVAAQIVMLRCKQGEGRISEVVKDYETPIVLDAVKACETARQASEDACNECRSMLSDAKDRRALMQPGTEFAKTLNRAVMIVASTAEQRTQVLERGGGAWAKLKGSAKGAPDAERDARLVCAWLLYSDEVRREHLSEVKDALKEVDRANREAPGHVQIALKNAHARTKKAAVGIGRIARPYKCSNVTAASKKLKVTLQNVESLCKRASKQVKTSGKSNDDARTRAQALQDMLGALKSMSFETPEEHQAVGAAAKRVLGRD